MNSAFSYNDVYEILYFVYIIVTPRLKYKHN